MTSCKEMHIIIIIIIIMEIYAAPKLSKYMTALGTYNVKSFTNKLINTCTSTHTHPHTHTLTYTHTHHTNTSARMRTQTLPHTQARSKKFVLRKIRCTRINALVGCDVTFRVVIVQFTFFLPLFRHAIQSVVLLLSCKYSHS